MTHDQFIALFFKVAGIAIVSGLLSASLRKPPTNQRVIDSNAPGSPSIWRNIKQSVRDAVPGAGKPWL